jgi:DNA polymerase I-like protein with 3'-5' exonuclease and polymerase domains
MLNFITNRPHHHQVSDNYIYYSADLSDVDIIIDSQHCGLDLETTGLKFNHDEILLIVLGDKHNKYVIDATAYTYEQIVQLFKRLQHKTFIGHNLGFDLPFLIERGVTFQLDKIYDTMIVEQVLTKGTKASVSLDNTVKRRLKLDVFDKGIRNEFIGMSKKFPIFYDRHITYASDDIVYLAQIKNEQDKHIIKYGQSELVTLNNNNVLVSSVMKVNGMFVYDDKWMDLHYKALKRCDELELLMDEELEKVGLLQRKKRIKKHTEQTDLFGTPPVDVVNKNINNINYGSSKQVLDIFRHFNLPIPKKAKDDKDSVGAKTIEQYIITHKKSILIPFLNLLLEYKITSKRVNTFGKKWVSKYVTPKSTVHPSFKVNSTATGRYSTSQPNLAQIPKLQEYRTPFCVRQPNNHIWTCDYSGAELRILASLSQDEVMLDLIKNNKDLHGYAATHALRFLSGDDSVIVDKKNNVDFRTGMKNVIFGLAYGAGVQRIAELLNIEKNKAEKVYQILSKLFPQAFDYLEKVSIFGKENGYIQFDDRLRQRRWFKEIVKGEKVSKAYLSSVERECKNSPIQGTNAYMMKLALVNIYRYIVENKLQSLIINTVYDEMIVEVWEGEEEHVEHFEKIMKDAGTYFLNNIEMEVEGNLGKFWSK